MDERRYPRGPVLRAVLLAAAAAASLLNGLPVSPLFDSLLFMLRPFLPSGLVGPTVLFYLTSIFIAVITFLLAGIPAAIYERVGGHTRTTPLSAGIWLAASLLLALPAILEATGFFDID